MIRAHAFVTDFDGTLYQYRHVPPISQADIDAIRAYRLDGGLFGISSARAFDAIRLETRDGIDFDFCLAVGGAVVADGSGGILAAQRLPFDVVAWVHGSFARDAIAVVIAAGSDLYSVGNRHSPLVRDISRLTDLPHDLYGLSIVAKTEQGAATITHRINEELGDVARATLNGMGVDVAAKGVGKASAMEKVRDSWGIDVVGAMGDADNDCQLLRYADVAYALPTATSSVASLSDVIVPSVAVALGDFADRVNTVEQMR